MRVLALFRVRGVSTDEQESAEVSQPFITPNGPRTPLIGSQQSEARTPYFGSTIAAAGGVEGASVRQMGVSDALDMLGVTPR